jgi:actin
MLSESGIFYNTAAERQMVRHMKETLTYVTLDFKAEMAHYTRDMNVWYNLPDGNHISIANERFRCPELMFQPELNGFDFNGIQHTIVDSIKKCDPEIQKDLFANIVLSGGTTMFPGFSDRIQKEIISLVPEIPQVKVVAPSEPKYASWLGGSILASLPTFPQIVITHEEYNDNGPRIIHKCLSFN